MQSLGKDNFVSLNPSFVTCLRTTELGLRLTTKVEAGDVYKCVDCVESSTLYFINKNLQTIRTGQFHDFRLAYKNEEKLCKG